MRRGAACAFFALVCGSVGARDAAAQSPELGAGARAVPGHFRVPVVAAASPGMRLAGAVGYGFIESQVDAPGTHHRIGGRAAAGVTLVRGLDLALGTTLRHDRHSASDARGSDQGSILSSELCARAGRAFADLHLGLGLSASFPGGTAVARSLQNPALDAQLLAAYVPEGAAWRLAMLAGLRYDRSASAMSDPRAYRAGDRLALGVSEFNAIPLGIGAGYRTGATEWTAEVSGDWLVGAGAPSLSRSPWRLSAGALHGLAEGVALTWVTETALSARPPTGSEDPLSPIEPRFQVLVGLAYRLLDWDAAPAAVARPVTAPAFTRPAAAIPAAPAAPASLQVNVMTADGYPLSDATVELELGQATLMVSHENLARYRLPEVPAGVATLRISAPRLQSHVQSIRLESGAPLIVDVQLEAAPQSGQLQGLVRSFGGRRLQAHIRIEPIGVELSTDAAGAFLMDVAPGRYEVVIEAVGHETQRRQVVVKPEGVVVINADLAKAHR